MNTFLNKFLKTCHPETHEIITNAEHAYQSGEITREQRDDVIRSAIAQEVEILALGKYPESGIKTSVLLQNS